MVVRVLSSGNPIPAAERNRIFERFYRGVDGLRVGPGSGLGLFVARKIALALGGSIELDGENPGAANGTVSASHYPLPKGSGTASPQLSSVLVVDDEAALRRT